MQLTNEAYPPAAISGVLLGGQFSAIAVAWLPKLGHIGSKAAAALVGVAPYDDDGVAHRGERRIKGGIRNPRPALFWQPWPPPPAITPSLSDTNHHTDACDAVYSARWSTCGPRSTAISLSINRKPKPFIWTLNLDRIIEKLNRGYQMSSSSDYKGFLRREDILFGKSVAQQSHRQPIEQA
jgi:hypothetical protein